MAFRDDETERLRADNARLTDENAELHARVEELARERERDTRPSWVWRGLKLGGILLIGLFVVGTAVVGISAVVTSCNNDSSGSARGQLAISGPTLGGTWTFEADRCRSGQALQFFGVDVADKTDRALVLRLLIDPIRGPVVKLNLKNTDRAWTFGAGDCKKHVLDIRQTNATVDDIRLLDGTLDLDCTLADGSTARGHLDLVGCD